MKQYAGIVTAVTVSESAQKSTLPKVYDEFTVFAKEFHDTGWVAKYDVPSLRRVQDEVRTTNGNGTAIGLTTFAKDGTEALLELASPGIGMAPGIANQGQFTLNVSFKNQVLDDAQGKKTYFERLHLNGNVNSYLPLSYWLKKQP